MSFKKINAWLHLWLGIGSGIIVLILSITGCILVFEQEIRSISSPWLYAESKGRKMLPPSRLYEPLAKALPHQTIGSVWYHGEGKTAHFALNSDSLVYINPYTAQIVAMVDHEDFFHFIDEGHRHLWLPEYIGDPIVGWSTMIFFLLLISGIILWWPKKWNKRHRDQSFKIKWKARFKRLNYDLHNVLGFYSLVIALLFAFTGLMISFSWFNRGVYWLAAGETTEPVKFKVSLPDTTAVPKAVMFRQADQAWKLAVSSLGELNPDQVIVSFPKKADEPIYICTDMKNGAWRDIYLDQQRLEVLPSSQVKLKDADLASWIRRSNYGLHVGLIGGLGVKIVYFLASLICASLPLTGFYIWWAKKKR